MNYAFIYIHYDFKSYDEDHFFQNEKILEWNDTYRSIK